MSVSAHLDTFARNHLPPRREWPDLVFTLTELQQFVKQSIAPYKYPRLIEFLGSLPRTETGKLQRYRLRTMAEKTT